MKFAITTALIGAAYAAEIVLSDNDKFTHTLSHWVTGSRPRLYFKSYLGMNSGVTEDEMIKSMIAQGLILVDPGVDVAFGDKKYITWDSREGRPDMEAAEWYEAIALRFFPGRPKDFANST